MPFETNVFINCPFDKRYKRLLHPLIFCCIYCKLTPRLSKLHDSGTSRIRQIVELISTSRFSIHDLSRMKAKKAKELARFNMPFELGLDLGIRKSGSKLLRSKKCLVIDSQRFRYRAAISDMGGSDIASYGKRNQVVRIIEVTRGWLTHALNPEQPSASKIYLEYTEFVADLQNKLQALDFDLNDIENLTNSEFMHYARDWIDNR